MSSIIESSIIEKHTAAFPEGVPLLEGTYASLNIKVSSCPIVSEPLFFHFKVDNSGSMSSECEDGLSKMDYLKDTIINMLHFFADKASVSTIFVQVCSFNNIISEIVPISLVTPDTVGSLIKRLNVLHPANTTNIELALTHSHTIIQEYILNNPTHRISHCFMTDGDTTEGLSSPELLAKIIPINISSSYIAFGRDHNARIMNMLGRSSIKSTNWFVESLQNAGLVYGEIINNEMYIGADSVVITMHNGRIYNFKTGQFEESLPINTLVTQTQKNYHVLLNPGVTDSEIYATITGVSNGEPFEEVVTVIPSLLDVMTNCIVPCDLTQQIFRYHTQNLMYQAMNFTPELQYNLKNYPPPPPRLVRQNALPFPSQLIPEEVYEDEDEEEPSCIVTPIFTNEEESEEESEEDEEDAKEKEKSRIKNSRISQKLLKNTLIDFHKSMLEYVEKNNLEDDSFMKSLCDDIYISIRTMGTPQHAMYIASRESSQGHQQMYTVTPHNFDDNDDENVSLSYQIQRCPTNIVNVTPTGLLTMKALSLPVEFDEFDACTCPP